MWELLIVFFIALVIYFDMKSRMIPDSLNFFFLFLGIALVIINSNFDFPFLSTQYMPFFLFNFAYAYLLYKFGVWAGGDVKFFTALMGMMPLYSGYNALAALSVFITSAIFLIPIAIMYYIKDILILRLEVRKLFISAIVSASKSTVVSIATLIILAVLIPKIDTPALLALLVIITFFVNIPLKLALPIFFLGFLFYRPNESLVSGTGNSAFLNSEFLLLLVSVFFVTLALHFLRSLFKLLSQKVLTHPVRVTDLSEGDIPAETYYFEGTKLKKWTPKMALAALKLKIKAKQKLRLSEILGNLRPKGKILIDSLRAAGLGLPEIKELKRLRVKEILVKESLPFAPVIAAAFLFYKYYDILAAFGIR